MATRYKLHYFNTCGIAETIRFIFAHADVQYEDIRHTQEEWVKVKPGETATPQPQLVMRTKRVAWTRAPCVWPCQSVCGVTDLVSQADAERGRENLVSVIHKRRVISLRVDAYCYCYCTVLCCTVLYCTVCYCINFHMSYSYVFHKFCSFRF